MTMSAPMTYGTAAPMQTYAPAYGGYPTMQQPMMTAEIVEKQRLEATTQLSSASGMQEKIMKDQYEAQIKTLDAEAERQIELTKQTYTQQLAQQKMALEQAYSQQTMALTMQKQQQSMMIETQASQMASQAAQYKMQVDMQQKT